LSRLAGMLGQLYPGHPPNIDCLLRQIQRIIRRLPHRTLR
jgi:hypothetical protein